jgi:hypothetical protein
LPYELDIQSLLFDRFRFAAMGFHACGDSEKFASILPDGNRMSTRRMEFDTVEEVIHHPYKWEKGAALG